MFDPHPILVHFPIAFITVYCLFEIISIKPLEKKPYWFYVKAITIFVGTLGAIVAGLVGYFISVKRDLSVPLVAHHFRLALATVIMAVFVSIIYLLVRFGSPHYQGIAWKVLSNRWAMVPLSLVLLALVTITGGLGGAMVYGLDFDPFMAPIWRLLGLLP